MPKEVIINLNETILIHFISTGGKAELSAQIPAEQLKKALEIYLNDQMKQGGVSYRTTDN